MEKNDGLSFSSNCIAELRRRRILHEEKTGRATILALLPLETTGSHTVFALGFHGEDASTTLQPNLRDCGDMQVAVMPGKGPAHTGEIDYADGRFSIPTTPR